MGAKFDTSKLKVDGHYTKREIGLISSNLIECENISNIEKQLQQKKGKIFSFVNNDIMKANLNSLSQVDFIKLIPDLLEILETNFSQEYESIKDLFSIKNNKLFNYTSQSGVKLIQHCLNILFKNGFVKDCDQNDLLKVDGIFGPKTFISVVKFQMFSKDYKESGSKIDGIVGEKTISGIMNYLKGIGNQQTSTIKEETATDLSDQEIPVSDKINEDLNQSNVQHQLQKQQAIEEQPIINKNNINPLDSSKVETENQNKEELIGTIGNGNITINDASGNTTEYNKEQIVQIIGKEKESDKSFYELLTDCELIIDAYTQTTNDNSLKLSYEEFLKQIDFSNIGNDKFKIDNFVKQLVGIIGGKFDKQIYLSDGDYIDDDITFSYVMNQKDSLTRNNMILQYIRNNLENHSYVSQKIVNEEFSNIFDNIKNEDFQQFINFVKTNNINSILSYINSNTNNNQLIKLLKYKYVGNNEQLEEYVASIKDKTISLEKHFQKSNEVLLKDFEIEYEKTYSKKPTEKEKSDYLSIIKNRFTNSTTEIYIKESLLLSMDIFKDGYKGDNYKLQLLSGIHGLGRFDLSDNTINNIKSALDILLIEAIAFAAGFFSIGVGYGLVKGISGLRVLSKLNKLYQANKYFSIGIKTLDFGFEGFMFYQGANLVHNIIENNDLFHGFNDLGEIGKTILFLKTMKALGILMQKFPALAVSTSDNLAQVTFKLSGQTLIEGLGIGTVGNTINVYFQEGEWTVQQYLDGILLALMGKALSPVVSNIQTGTQQFIVKNINGQISLFKDSITKYKKHPEIKEKPQTKIEIKDTISSKVDTTNQEINKKESSFSQPTLEHKPSIFEGLQPLQPIKLQFHQNPETNSLVLVPQHRNNQKLISKNRENNKPKNIKEKTNQEGSQSTMKSIKELLESGNHLKSDMEYLYNIVLRIPPSKITKKQLRSIKSQLATDIKKIDGLLKILNKTNIESLKTMDLVKINTLIENTNFVYTSIHGNTMNAGKVLMNSSCSYYEFFGVSRSDSIDKIDIARKKMLKIFHPDLGGSKEISIYINEAWQMFKNPFQRFIYDEAIYGI